MKEFIKGVGAMIAVNFIIFMTALSWSYGFYTGKSIATLQDNLRLINEYQKAMK